VTDRDWMRWNHKAPPASPSPREEMPGFVYVKDVRVMTGVLRPLDDTRWEVVCKVNGELYKAEVVSSRQLAEQHLAKNRNTLEAIGWVESSGSSWAGTDMAERKVLGLKWAVVISIVLNVGSTLIWYFGQEASARPDLSSDSTFFAIAMAAVFVVAAWAWYTLPWKDERDHDW
jgi:hypothetical protein